MPPFSPSAKGALPNSMNEFCPEKPCQPSLRTQGGSMRPVESAVPVQVVAPVVALIVQELGASLLPGPLRIDLPVQSAVLQYTAPGTRRGVGTDTVSKELAMLPAIVELLQGAVVELQVPSAGPPASYTT